MLLSIAVLIIPYIGFDYLRQMETYLRETLEASVVDATYAVAGALNDKPKLFESSFNETKNSIYVHQLNNPIHLDGYTDDWLSYIDWSETYTSETMADGDNFKLIVSKDDDYFYVLIQVIDDSLTYSTLDNDFHINGDHVVVVYHDKYQRLQKDYLAPSGPGLIRPFRYEEAYDEYGVEIRTQKDLTNTAAVWQAVNDGYNIEIKIPAYLLGGHLGFVLNDVDDAHGHSENNIISTFGSRVYAEPGKIISSSKRIENIIYSQGRSEGRRIWVLDKSAQVLASDGSLKRVFPDNAFNIVYTLLLPPAYDQFKDDLAGASRLQGNEVKQALSGDTQTRWRSSPDGKAVIVSAATPIWFDNKVVGAVVVEETTNNIQIMQRQVLAGLFNKTLLIFLVIVFLLLLFASRLSSRLIKLNRETTEAIDEHGKVIGEVSVSNSSDEVGELSRSFNNMLERLHQYHSYLEGMASRLSHELRTPMAIVKSSLDRLQNEHDEAGRKVALQAADTGLQRLQALLTRLSEAARLEQALQEAEKQPTNLNEFLTQCIAGYQSAYPDQSFKINMPETPINYSINRDLFFQMLDKLVGNAVEFSHAGKAITVNLIDKKNAIELQIINVGPELPEDMLNDLFNSMVSIRTERSGTDPHLGLGLFVARLIVEFHGGTVSAMNLANRQGVCMTIALPVN
ncbi:MAG: proteobacterial dedicated sortase system histidine kinase [marine bacterium B5-7]|nr:MAG: proteobacterial dedicated sortase system histidine kinase [marine bacterium B5-7]